MQTYAEKVGQKPINWWDRLDQLEKLNKKLAKDYYSDNHLLTIEERELVSDSIRASSRWTTCACGNQCDIIPRYNSPIRPGEPLDAELSDLGVDFYRHVAVGRINEARRTLHKIEERSTFLINEIRRSQVVVEGIGEIWNSN